MPCSAWSRGSPRSGGRPASGARLVAACADVVGVTGAGIMLMADDEHRATLGGSDATIRVVEELQFTLGEGPCVDSYRSGQPVLEPRLAHPAVTRWPGFAGPAVDAGIQAIFGFPLHVDGVRIGALDLYRDQPGELRPAQLADALVMADVVAGEVLELEQAGQVGSLADALDDRTRLRAVVHQATGMLSAQLDVPVGEALTRLRAARVR